ncbi:hypothetical protein B0T16DRAFT_461952 [Cercophora newfieldiana]|uniref:DUF7587 domain-containing protein n=1 Tax=Cercophora newfieldiana TaxID=92897 RepID=A0AA39XX89_9PEZI|nr:hypothetical protein B0T16DRAFT_461952 [Cercophora newfieldiana]
MPVYTPITPVTITQESARSVSPEEFTPAPSTAGGNGGGRNPPFPPVALANYDDDDARDDTRSDRRSNSDSSSRRMRATGDNGGGHSPSPHFVAQEEDEDDGPSNHPGGFAPFLAQADDVQSHAGLGQWRAGSLALSTEYDRSSIGRSPSIVDQDYGDASDDARNQDDIDSDSESIHSGTSRTGTSRMDTSSSQSSRSESESARDESEDIESEWSTAAHRGDVDINDNDSDDSNDDGGGDSSDDEDDDHELVPVETIQVVRWGTEDKRQRDNPDVKVWQTQTQVPLFASGTRVWVENGSNLLDEMCEMHGTEIKRVISRHTSGGFVKGRPLRDVSVPVSTCGGEGRPRYVYRAIHRGNERVELTSFGGIKARGFGRRETDALAFQNDVQKHINPTSHHKSPFMSVVDSLPKALDWCESYRDHGYDGIELLKIKTSGPEWDHKKQRLWKLAHLASTFGFRVTSRNDHEYLIENSIPPDAVVRRWGLRDVERRTGHDFELDIDASVKAERYLERCASKNDWARAARRKRMAEEGQIAEPIDRTRSRGFGKLVVVGAKVRRVEN